MSDPSAPSAAAPAAAFSSQPAVSAPPPSQTAQAFGDVAALEAMNLDAVNAEIAKFDDPRHPFRNMNDLRFNAANDFYLALHRRAVTLEQGQQSPRVGPWSVETPKPEPEPVLPLPPSIRLPELPLGESWDPVALADLHSGALREGVGEGDLVAFLETFAAEIRDPLPRANADTLIDALERQHGSAEAAADVLEQRGLALAAFPQFRQTFMNSPARYSPRVATLLAQVWQSRARS
jgi:hypothetical protein